jgi:diketogulonate reductase-like aldo/keto reductase
MTKVKDDLKQLGLAQADMILLHNPTTKGENAKQYAQLEQALAIGLTRAIGISDFSKAQVADLLETAKVMPAVNQCEMSVGHHDDENIAFCQANNITYEAWNVLKGCDRTNPTVVAVAQTHNKTTFQVCLRFIVDRGAVMAVGTGSDPSSVASFTKKNLGIFDFKLTTAEMTQLNAV